MLLAVSELDDREADDPSGSHFLVRHTQPLKSRNLSIAVDATWLGPHQTGAQVLTTAAVEALANDERVTSIRLSGIAELPDYAAHLARLDKVSLESEARDQARELARNIVTKAGRVLPGSNRRRPRYPPFLDS